MALGVFLDLVSALDFVIQWGAGWRYVFSPSFRRRTHERWCARSRLGVSVEIAFLLLGFIIVNALLLFGALLAYAVVFGPIRSVHEW